MYTNLDYKHYEDDVGKAHRNCSNFESGICLFNNKPCIGSSNCGSLYNFKKKTNSKKGSTSVDNFDFDTTKQVYYVTITEQEESFRETIYISNRTITELERKKYLCVKSDTPVALKLKNSNTGSEFSVIVNDIVTKYKVLEIKFLDSNFNEIILYKDAIKKRRVNTRNTIPSKLNKIKNEKQSQTFNNVKEIKKNEKPTLVQYNLSNNDLLKYQKYKIDEKNIIEKNLDLKKRKDEAEDKRLTIIIASFVIASIIVGLCFSIFCEKNEKPPSIFLSIVILLGLPILISYISQKIYKFNNSIFYEDYFTIHIENYLDTKTILNLNRYFNNLKEYENYEMFTSEEFWNSLNGYQFEEKVAELFRKIGYLSVRRTQGSYDGGVDISMEKDGEKYAVQCKHHSRPVGAEPLRALHGILDNYDKGIFVSLNGYTNQAIYENYSWTNSLKLYSLKDIIRLYKEYFDKVVLEEQQDPLDDSTEWVYDNIFSYGIVDLEQFAKDVGCNIAGKNKNELIKTILRTLTINELIEICERYGIVQTKEDIINLIIKNKDKMKQS